MSWSELYSNGEHEPVWGGRSPGRYGRAALRRRVHRGSARPPRRHRSGDGQLASRAGRGACPPPDPRSGRMGTDGWWSELLERGRHRAAPPGCPTRTGYTPHQADRRGARTLTRPPQPAQTPLRSVFRSTAPTRGHLPPVALATGRCPRSTLGCARQGGVGDGISSLTNARPVTTGRTPPPSGCRRGRPAQAVRSLLSAPQGECQLPDPYDGGSSVRCADNQPREWPYG